MLTEKLNECLSSPQACCAVSTVRELQRLKDTVGSNPNLFTEEYIKEQFERHANAAIVRCFNNRTACDDLADALRYAYILGQRSKKSS